MVLKQVVLRLLLFQIQKILLQCIQLSTLEKNLQEMMLRD